MPDLVTVYRSSDPDAEDQAAEVAEMLRTEGIKVLVLDDDAPHVPEGAYEVQVEEPDVSRAEALIDAMRTREPDESHNMDLVTIFVSGDGTSEGDMEALTVKNLLEAAGIEAILVGGDVPIPSLSHEVKVARRDADEARRVIAEAQSGNENGSAG
jgi:hypothetical protein